jgi:hypothetical protein
MNSGIMIVFVLLGYAMAVVIAGYALYWIIRLAVTHGIRAARQQSAGSDDSR